MKAPLLSLLICSLRSREAMLARLCACLAEQIDRHGYRGVVQVLVEQDDGELSIGAKRNILMGRAQGMYVCFLDDDDEIAPTYCEKLVEACKKGPDCVGLTGEIYVKAARRPHKKRFEMSLKYEKYSTGKKSYERTPNHLCPIRRSIAVRFPFDDINEGEDGAYANAMANANALRSEVFIDEPVYLYTPSGLGVNRRKRDRSSRHVKPGYVRLWKDQGYPVPMPDQLKWAAIEHYQQKTRAQYFVETGTYHGDTAFRMTKRFGHIHTIEASQLLFGKLKPPHGKWPDNITCHLGKSYELLEKIVTPLDGTRVFWLDAHGAGWGREVVVEEKGKVPRPKQGATPDSIPWNVDVPACSLLSELEVLYPLLKPGDVLLIDDANLFGEHGWPPVCQVYAHAHTAGLQVRREALLMVIEVPEVGS